MAVSRSIANGPERLRRPNAGSAEAKEALQVTEDTFGGNWRRTLLSLFCTVAVVGAALTYAMMS